MGRFRNIFRSNKEIEQIGWPQVSFFRSTTHKLVFTLQGRSVIFGQNRNELLSILTTSMNIFKYDFGCSPMLILLLWSFQSSAQYQVRHITTNDGLIQGSVYYFLEDSRGYIWMTCQAGLNRFDGQQVKSFAHDNLDAGSIGKGEVRGLAEAPNGDIWMGTEVCISRYVRKTNKFENNYLLDSSGNRLLSHHQVFFADDSTVWYLNDRQGVGRLNYRTGKRSLVFFDAGYRYEPATRVVDFDPVNQVLWLRQAFGVVRFEVKSKKVNYFFSGKSGDPFAEKLVVYAIYSKDHQTIWLSTNKGLVELSGSSYKLHHIGIDMATDFVYAMVQDAEGKLWLTTPKSGLIIYSSESGKVTERLKHDARRNNSLASDYLSDVFIDSKGVIWANVGVIGVDIISPAKMAPVQEAVDYSNADYVNDATVRGIDQDQEGNLWVGTLNDGVRVIAPTSGKVHVFRKNNGLPQESIRGVFCDSSGNIWICSKGGLAVRRKNATYLSPINIPSAEPSKSNHIRGITEISSGNYIVATMSGLYGYRFDTGARLMADANVAFTGSLYYDKVNKKLYAGRNDKDLICYQVKNEMLVRDYNILDGYNIMSFLEDGARHLWIGTDNGLVYFDRQQAKVLKIYAKSSGLPDNVVYSVIRDENGALWMSTNRGVVRFDEKKGIFQHIRSTAGKEFNSFAYLKGNDGKLYFGSTHGLLSIEPVHLTRLSSRGLHFSELRVNDSLYYDISQEQIDFPQLNYHENNLTFEVAALDFTAKVPTLYEYRLVIDNKPANWINNGANQNIRLLNLNPDSYKLEVRAVDSNGIYTPTVAFRVIILQPLWLSWWFLLMMFLLAVIIIFYLVRFYINYRQQVERRLTGHIINAQESERLRIARDLHDDVGNTLATAKGLLNVIKDKILIRAEFPEVEKAHVLIERAGDDLRSVTHDLIPVDFTRFDLHVTVSQLVEKANSSSGIDLSFICDGSIQKLPAEKELVIYRIVSELITNVLKHSKATEGFIQMLYKENTIIITVEDNGIGNFSGSAVKKVGGIGLENVYSRIQFLNAVWSMDQNHSGTCIIFEIPYEFSGSG